MITLRKDTLYFIVLMSVLAGILLAGLLSGYVR